MWKKETRINGRRDLEMEDDESWKKERRRSGRGCWKMEEGEEEVNALVQYMVGKVRE